jgi:hypothetical protein
MHRMSLTVALLLTALVVCPAASIASQPPDPQPPTEEPVPDNQVEEPEIQEVQPVELTEAERRPFRGQFGGARPYSHREPGLDLTLSAIGGFDNPINYDVAGQTDRFAIEGPFAGTSASLSYLRFSDVWPVSAFGSAFIGYFPENEENPWYPSGSAAVTTSRAFSFGSSTRLTLSLYETYASDQQLFGMIGLSPTDIPVAGDTAGFDNSLKRAPALTSAPSVTLQRRFGSQATLQAFYRYSHVHYLDSDQRAEGYKDRQDQVAGVGYTRRVTRHLAVRGGYAYRRSELLDDDQGVFELHDLDLGVDYGRAISLSRRTHLTFRTGTALTAEMPVNANDSVVDDTRFFVVGGATLTHEIGRSWRAYADYARDVGYENGFVQPVLRDGARVGLGGLLSRSTDFASQLAYISGSFGFDDRNYETLLGTVQVRKALTTNLALYGHYYYYWQDFGEDVLVPTGVIRDVERQGVRFGLTAWIPLKQ